ncbi:hypothetical protein M979_0473 [Buttiauxella noackiae ATCC 51607]|uniref:Uncharacterized protein n=1 Tax=Buttiauxella noackiae ATCC 51607 TaxID=1354255 RepID=A0A1B7HYI5_9ENTR|nr:hypothetical protein M979_0473 [Buttiauxella noackiae ATCC 51607]
MRGFIFIGIVVFAVIKGCSGGSSSSDSSYHSNDVASSSTPTSQPFVSPDVAKVKAAVPVNMAPADTKPFSASQVCKATIASLFSPMLGDIKAATTKQEGVYRLTYKRRLDGEKYSYDCKLSDDSVIWTETGQSTNRWRGTGNVGYSVAFTVKGSDLIITELYADADNVTHKYALKDFR